MLKQPTPTYQPKKKNEKQEKGGALKQPTGQKKEDKEKGGDLPSTSQQLHSQFFHPINFELLHH